MSQFLPLIGLTLGEKSVPKQAFQRYAPGRQAGSEVVGKGGSHYIQHPAGETGDSLYCLLQTLRKSNIITSFNMQTTQ